MSRYYIQIDIFILSEFSKTKQNETVFAEREMKYGNHDTRILSPKLCNDLNQYIRNHYNNHLSSMHYNLPLNSV